MIWTNDRDCGVNPKKRWTNNRDCGVNRKKKKKEGNIAGFPHKTPSHENRVIGQNVLMANPNQRMFHSPYGDHSIQ